MPLTSDDRPEWLTFDCYGTLIQWDEGVRQVAARVIEAKRADADPDAITKPYDQHESELEENAPFKTFHQVAPEAFRTALGELGVDATEEDGRTLLDSIPGFIPFPETLDTLAALKAGGFRIALISNTDDDLIAGNVAQLGGHVDHVVTAGQARSYKPSRLIFDYALSALGIGYDRMVHVCASPALDHAAARDQRFRCVWIDRGTYRKPLADYTADETLPTLTGLPDLFAKLGWMANR
jgi:2-haloacid dehalogenase